MTAGLIASVFLGLAPLLMAAPALATPQVPATAPASNQRPAEPPKRERVRVFLDCNHCDEDHIRKEVTFIDYVRNREDADVHVLVTLQETGGGGAQWTLKFIGLGTFQGSDQTLTYNSLATATSEEIRAGFIEVFKLGLVRYAITTPMAERLRVTFKKLEGDAAAAAKKKDPWNYWVYRISFHGDVNGEESSKGRSMRGSFNANRTTDAWRMSFNTSANYRDTEFKLEEEDGTKTTILSVNRNMDASGTVVKSLTQHWSLGFLGSANSQTFRNFVVKTRIASGLEYNFFPYTESTRRMLTFQYTVGHDYLRYREITIFDKLKEQLLDHRAEVGLSLRQPWGSAQAQMSFTQYLTNPSKYSLGTFGFGDFRIFKGFSVNFFGEYARTRDQIYLPRGAASTEEILLRQRQLLTGYQYFLNFGISYQFGSIFNNIVNPRFGGGGF
jgi:hypothetical protein